MRERQRCRLAAEFASGTFGRLANDGTARIGTARVRSGASVLADHGHAADIGARVTLLGGLNRAVTAVRAEAAAGRAAAVEVVVVHGGKIAVLGEFHPELLPDFGKHVELSLMPLSHVSGACTTPSPQNAGTPQPAEQAPGWPLFAPSSHCSPNSL